jgi:predicted secreted protein
MAFQDKVIDGGDIILKVDGKVIACATSHTIELTNATREISCKGSGDFTSAEYGRFSWTVSTDALLNLGKDEVEYISYPELMQLMLAKTVVTIESVYDENSAGTDTMTASGGCIITSISKTAPDSDNSSYSVSLQGRGELSLVTVNP